MRIFNKLTKVSPEPFGITKFAIMFLFAVVSGFFGSFVWMIYLGCLLHKQRALCNPIIADKIDKKIKQIIFLLATSTIVGTAIFVYVSR